MPDHDVLVVGAGPVGLLAACLLVQAGRRVLVCERRTDPGDRTRAIGIHRPGLDALEAVGIGYDVRAAALSLAGGEVRSRGRTLAALAFTPNRPILILPQPRADVLLRDRLDALDPQALMTGTSVRAVRDEGALVRVVLEGAEGRRTVTASLVVVADGVHSPLRRAFGVAWSARPGRAAYAMADVADADAGDRALLFCEPEGLVESFPLPDGRRRWVVRQGAGASIGTGAELRATIERRTGLRAAVPDDADVSSFAASQHVAQRVQRGRVVLLGDAAHELSPIGGQGMNLGWSDAVRLAAALEHWAPAHAPALAAFARRTQRGARTAQRRSTLYMAMGAPAGTPLVAAREALIRGLGSGVLRGWTAGIITMRGL